MAQIASDLQDEALAKVLSVKRSWLCALCVADKILIADIGSMMPPARLYAESTVVSISLN